MKITSKISVKELKDMAKRMYGNIVKTDVDVAKKKVIVDKEMHADGEAQLLEAGSKQKDLWGINLIPDAFGTDKFIEFDSMINLKPSQSNPSRDVLDQTIREQKTSIINEVVHE